MFPNCDALEVPMWGIRDSAPIPPRFGQIRREHNGGAADERVAFAWDQPMLAMGPAD
jgi:hypothetical protein